MEERRSDMKVNDYVRTTNGYIGEIFNINEYREMEKQYKKAKNSVFDKKQWNHFLN